MYSVKCNIVNVMCSLLVLFHDAMTLTSPLGVLEYSLARVDATITEDVGVGGCDVRVQLVLSVLRVAPRGVSRHLMQ